jgi:hypothetical protein
MQDRMLCYCLLKRASDIAAAWKSSGHTDIRSFMERTRLGTICTSCRGDLYQLVEAIARGEAMPPVLSSTPQLTSLRQPALSLRNRAKRWVKRLLKKRTGMQKLEFHAMACAGDGWSSVLQLSNSPHPDFVGRITPLIGRVTVYGPDGAVRHVADISVPIGGCITIDVGRFLETADPASRSLGLVHVVYHAPNSRAARRWYVGTNRPYVTWQKDGRPLTIHEKSVHFDRWCALPGVIALPGFEMELCFANIGNTSGTVAFRSTRGHGGDASEEVIAVGPFESRVWKVPFTNEGALLEQVEASSTIALTGYQLVRSQRSGLFAIQHLVKEGS